VNAHALRQLTVSVNHGDERITGNKTAVSTEENLSTKKKMEKKQKTEKK